MSVRAVPAREAAPRRALGLIRVSLEKDGTTSPENQRHAIERYAAERGLSIVDWIEGIDESGSQRKSAWWPKLDEAISRMESGEVEVIVVWQFSRTARQRLRWAIALDRVDVAGGSLESATERTDNTPSGRFARGMHGEMNAYYAELIGETWKETHERRRRQGLPPTGGGRFGYRIVDRAYVIDADVAPVLADLYVKFLAGAGWAQLVRQMNSSGVLTVKGSAHWSHGILMQMLDSGFAAGLLSRTRTSGKGGRVLPVWERKYDAGAHEPIIDRATWDAYVAARARRTSVPTRTPKRFLLTGIIRCGDCDGAMQGRRWGSDVDYVCGRAADSSGSQYLHVSIRASIVEREVEAWTLRLARDVSARARAEEGSRAAETKATFTRRSLENRIEKAKDRIANLTIRLADERISDEAYAAAAAVIEAERVDAEAQLKRVAPNPVRGAAPMSLPADLARLWPEMTTEKRASVIRPLIEKVVVKPTRGSGKYRDRVVIVPAWDDEGEEVMS